MYIYIYTYICIYIYVYTHTYRNLGKLGEEHHPPATSGSRAPNKPPDGGGIF